MAKNTGTMTSLKKVRTAGFFAKKRTAGGLKVVAARRRKGRAKLTFQIRRKHMR